jgi:hypothetical protein
MDYVYLYLGIGLSIGLIGLALFLFGAQETAEVELDSPLENLAALAGLITLIAIAWLPGVLFLVVSSWAAGQAKSGSSKGEPMMRPIAGEELDQIDFFTPYRDAR